MDLQNLKLPLQRHFSDRLVIVVASGLSCAEDNLPTGEGYRIVRRMEADR